MRTIIGQAIVIDKRDYKEADIKVLLSTDRFGHIYAIGPNAKKSKRRFTGGLNIFSLLEFSADRKGDSYILNESTLLNENETAFSGLNPFIAASSFTEIASRLYTLNNPDETAFYRLRFSLEHLFEQGNISLVYSFLKSSMIDTGEFPEFINCAVCQGNIGGRRILFNYFKGGVLCNECMKKDGRGESISHNLYRFMLSDEPETGTFPDNVIRQGIFLLERYLRFRLNVTFKSLQFI